MVRARFAAAALGALLLAACPADDVGDVDAGPDVDAGDGGDADVGGPSLLFYFETEPDVPGQVDEGSYPIAVTEVRVKLEDVRSFGDAAPGDERTTVDKVDLRFEDRTRPNLVYFPEAPPSRYSHLAALIESYTFKGTVVLDQDPIPFTISEVPPTPLSVTVELEGVEVTSAIVEVLIEIEIELLKEVNWETFDPGTTAIEINGSSPLIDEIRNRLREAFEHEHD